VSDMVQLEVVSDALRYLEGKWNPTDDELLELLDDLSRVGEREIRERVIRKRLKIRGGRSGRAD
jgi:hypothetical protein